MNNKKQLTKVSVLIDKLNYLNDNLNLNELNSDDVDFKLLKNYSLELVHLLNEFEQSESIAVGSHEVKEQLFDHIPAPPQPVKQVKNHRITTPSQKKKIAAAPELNKIVVSDSDNIVAKTNATDNIFDTVKAIKNQSQQQDEVTEKADLQPLIKEAKHLKIEGSEEKDEDVVIDVPKPSAQPEIKMKQNLSKAAVEEAEEAENLSLNDRFKAATESVATKVPTSSGRNFKELIDINDRFLFIQSLFGGSYLAFEEAIKQINKIETYSEALDYVDYKLKGTYDWSADSTEVTKFLNILERSYAS